MPPDEAPNETARIPTRCSEVMHVPFWMLDEYATVLDAARSMRDNEIGFLAVCGPTGGLLGVITDRDITTRLVAEERAAHASVASIMTPVAITCLGSDSLAKAERLMRDHQITRIVVTDAHRGPVGVVSLTDLAQYVPAAQVGRTLQVVSERTHASDRTTRH